MATLAAQPPRSGLPRKSGVLDLPDAYSYKMQRWRDDLFRQGASEMQAWKSFQEIERIIGYLEGDWYGSNRPAYRSNFFDSYLSDQRREALASLSDIRPSIDITSSVEAYKAQAKVQHAYIRHLWSSENLDLKIVTWLDHSLFGTGFMKMVARPNQFMFSAHGPDQVIPVQCNGELQSSGAVVYKAYKSLGYFQNSFGPEKCIGLERQSVKIAQQLGTERYQRPAGVPEYTWDALSPRLQRRVSLRNASLQQQGNNYTPFPVIPLMEIYYDDWSINEFDHPVWIHHPDLGKDEHNYHYIVPPGARLYPRKRLVVFAGDRVMYDGPSPFWHGLYPFAMLQLNPCVWSPGGISKYHDLIPLCRSINAVGAGIDESVMRCVAEGTPIWCPDGTTRPVEEVVAQKLDVLTFLNGKVEATTPTEWHDNGEQKTMKVIMASGRSIIATKNHRWVTRQNYEHGSGKLHVHTTDELQVGMSVPMPVECPIFGDRLGYEDGYLMGSMNGDGWMSSGGSNPMFVGIPGDGGTEEFVRCAESLGDRVTTGRVQEPSGLTDFRVSKHDTRDHSKPSNLCTLLREEEMWGLKSTEKNLPKQGYSREFYAGYVAGLFDTDGCVICSKGRENVTVSSISEEMIRQASDILLRFGVYSWVFGPYEQQHSAGLPRFNPDNCKPVWRLTVSDRNSIIAFGRSFVLKNHKKQDRLEKLVVTVGRKVSRRTSKGRDGSRHISKRYPIPDGTRMDRIVGIFPAGVRKTYCVTVEPSHLWVVNGIITMQSLNGTWVAKRGAIPEAVWEAFQPGKPGQKVLLNPVANINEFKEMQAPNLPQQVAEWLKYLVDDVKRRSGSLDIQGLSRKKQAPGGDAIEQMRDTMSSPFRLEGRYLEAGLEQCGEQTISNIFQYADLDSRLRLLGADGVTWEDFDYRASTMVPDSSNPETHWTKFAFKIAPGSSHGASRQSAKVEAFTLYKAGALSMEGLYELISAPANAKIEMERIKKEHEMGIGGGGRQPRQNRAQRNGAPM